MTYQKLNDEQLMLCVANGDQSALEYLYDTYASSVMGLVLKVVRDRTIAEEIVQETFWRVWSKANTYEAQRGSLTAWLFSIAHRLAIDSWRQQKVRPQAVENETEVDLFEAHPDPDSNVPEMATMAIQRRQIQAAMLQLSPEQSQVIRLSYFYGLTRQEIAETLGDPLGTVHTRARLALQKLGKLLQAQGVESL